MVYKLEFHPSARGGGEMCAVFWLEFEFEINTIVRHAFLAGGWRVVSSYLLGRSDARKVVVVFSISFMALQGRALQLLCFVNSI